MQRSGSTSTMPFSYCTIAPGAGQAARQPGSSQCMQPSLRISQASPPSCVSCSEKRIRFQNSACSVGSVWYVPKAWLATGARSFHSWQATSQALQPMQVVVSMYFATLGDLRRLVDSPRSEAEERRISPEFTPRASHLLDLDQERLVLGRPHVRLEHRGRERVRQRSHAHSRVT